MKKNNKGFSLVEIIIAAAVLVLLAVPMARGIITAVNTSSKGKIQMQATGVAQNVMEELLVTPVESIAADDATWKAFIKDEVTNSFVEVTTMEEREEADLFKSSIIGREMSGNKYDMLVSLDATKYDAVNGAGLVSFDSMDFGQDAYYEEEAGMSSQILPGTATTVKEAFREELEERGLDEATINSALLGIEKHIEINVNGDIVNAEGEIQPVVTISYAYQLSSYGCRVVMVDEETIYDATFTGNPLRNIFLFFWADINTKNYIVLNNPKDIPVTLQLMKQSDNSNTSILTDVYLTVNESNTDPLWYNDPSYKANTILLTNFGVQEDTCIPDGLYKLHVTYSRGLSISNDMYPDKIKTTLECAGITGSNEQKRLYGVQIEVYKHRDEESARFQATDKVFTLDGTKEK